MGLDVVELSKKEAQDLEPEVELDVLGGVHYRCDAHLYPNDLIRQLINLLQESGVQIHPHTTVHDVEVKNGNVKKSITSKGAYEADLVVLASGSWCRSWQRSCGFHCP